MLSFGLLSFLEIKLQVRIMCRAGLLWMLINFYLGLLDIVTCGVLEQGELHEGVSPHAVETVGGRFVAGWDLSEKLVCENLDSHMTLFGKKGI
jgi:hypothetical protein